MSSEAPTEVTEYACQTQNGVDATFGAAPVAHLPTIDSNDKLVLGIGSIIPRWDVTKSPNRKLLYFVRTDTFKSAEQAKAAATALQAAADEWNKLAIGLTITSTPTQATANFYLIYVEPRDPADSTLARAFFPNEQDQDVLVYKSALTAANRSILKSIFLHELGHVLGLRHEFAITGDPDKGLSAEGEGAVQFMAQNYKSVMSYNFPPTMQQSDKDGVKAFYKLANGFVIEDSPVTDYLPQIRNRLRNPAPGEV